MSNVPWQALLTSAGVTPEELDAIKAGLMRLADDSLPAALDNRSATFTPDEPATLLREQPKRSPEA